VLYSVVIVKQLIGKRSRASGQSNLTQECIAATDARFSGIRQVAPMCPDMWAHWRHLVNTIEIVHIGVTWRLRLNSWYFRPTQVHNLNGKSIALAISAQLTAECPYTLQWVTLFPKIASSHRGDLDAI